MKKSNLSYTIMVIMFLIVLPIVFGYGAGIPSIINEEGGGTAHQYLTNESQHVWKLTPYEFKQHLRNNLSVDIAEGAPPHTYSDYNDGDDIITGSWEEDIPLRFVEHYWNADYPDIPNEGGYDQGLYPYLGSYVKAEYLWKEEVIPNYLKGNINESYYWLGRVVHLLQDASVPAHMHNDEHALGDQYEKFVADINNTFPDTQNKNNFYHVKGSNYVGQEYRYENLSYLSESDWEEINPRLKEVSYQENFFKLFWYTAQKTQYFASDDSDGNSYYKKSGDNTEYTFTPSLWQTNEANITSDSSLIEDASTCNSTGKCPNLRNISNALMPHAMKATAGLYELFYDTANSYHWPTFHHDNRRTGFTLLRGDMTKESKVAKINLVLQGDVTSDSIARPSIADVDGNGNMETVVATARNANEGYIYAIETKKTLLTPITKRLKTEEKWHINIGKNILVTPTIANIDSDSVKEVVFGLDNGSLYAIDVPSSGDSASVKWSYAVDKFGGGGL